MSTVSTNLVIVPIQKTTPKAAKPARCTKAKVISTARIVKTLKYFTEVSLGGLVADIGVTSDVVLLALQEAVASRTSQKGAVKQDAVRVDESSS